MVAPGNIVVGFVPVGHHDRTWPDSSEQPVGQFCAVPRCIGEASDRHTRTRHLRPQVARRLWPAAFLFQHLERRLVAIDQFSVKQRVAQQVDHRLRRETNADHAGSNRVRRDVATESTQQASLAIQRHAELILAGGDPRERRFTQQPTTDDACRRWRDLDKIARR